MKTTDQKSTKKTRPLNLRDFPDDLYWECKVRAAKERITLKQYVVSTLQRAIKTGTE